MPTEPFLTSKTYTPKDIVSKNFDEVGDDIERTNQLRAFGLQSQNQLRMMAFDLIGKKKTVENMRQVDAINKSFEQLTNIMGQSYATSNDAVIDEFERQEKQRISFFGGRDNVELNNLVDSLVTTARKHNLNLSISELEQDAWSVLRDKQTEIKTALAKEDYTGLSGKLQDFGSEIRSLAIQGIISEKRANLYYDSVKRATAKSLVVNANDKANLLAQTHGFEESKKFLDNINSSFSDSLEYLDNRTKAEWLKKVNSVNEVLSDTGSLHENFADVEKNFHLGYGNSEGLEKSAQNLIKSLNNDIKKPISSPSLKQQKHKQNLMEIKEDVVGRLAMIRAIRQEFIDVSDGAKDKFQLLNPYSSPSELANIMATIVEESPEKGDKFVSALYDMRARFLSSISGDRPENVHKAFTQLVEKLDNTIGYKTSNSILKEQREGVLGIEDRIDNEFKIAEMLGQQPSISSRTSNDLSDFLFKPKTPEETSQFQQVVDSLLDKGVDLRREIIKNSDKKEARVSNQNYIGFIKDYNGYFPNAGSSDGFNMIKHFLATNNKDFSTVVEKAYDLIKQPELYNMMSELSRSSGYDVDTVMNGVVMDVALGVMDNQFNFGVDTLRNLSSNPNELNFSGPWSVVLDYATQNLNAVNGIYKQIGRTHVVNDASDIFSDTNKIDKKVLGFFDKSLADTGLFERFGESVKDIAFEPIRNLDLPYQKKVESFIKNFLPETKGLRVEGRIRLLPSSNGFYRIGLDNGFGAVNFITNNGQALVINPSIYRSLSSGYDKDKITDEQASKFLIDVITLSNKLPRDPELGNL